MNLELTKAETRIYAAGIALQSTLPPKKGVTLRQVSEATGYAIKTVHQAAMKLQRKRMAGWSKSVKNNKKGGLRFWQVRRKSA